MSRKLLDSSCRPYLLEQGFKLGFDGLKVDVGLGSIYERTPSEDLGGAGRPALLTVTDTGFIGTVEIQGAETPREIVDQFREPDDAYQLLAYPPAVPETNMGGWSLGFFLDDDTWEGFDGLSAVVADPQLCQRFVTDVVSSVESLQQYVARMLRRVSTSGDGVREWVFGGLQSIFDSPELIDSGEVPAQFVLNLFRRAFTLVPDESSYVPIRKWIQARSMNELANGVDFGPWGLLSRGVQEFGREQGWDVWSYP